MSASQLPIASRILQMSQHLKTVGAAAWIAVASRLSEGRCVMVARTRLGGRLLVGLAFLLATGSTVLAEEAGLVLDRTLTFADADRRVVRSTDFRGKWLLV